MEKLRHILHFDLITTRKSVAILLSVYFVFGIYYAYFLEDLKAVPISIMIWVTSLTGLPFQLNEKYGVNYLLATFPIRRKNIIQGRYLYSLLFGAIGISLSEIMICILASFFHIGFDHRQIYLSLCFGVLIFSLIISVYLPMYFWFTHVHMLMVSSVFVYFFYILLEQLYYLGILNVSIDTAIVGLCHYFMLAIAIIFLISAILVICSYCISCKLFLNKDI
jgi:ABC-2 type transport system permease protein